MTEITAGLTTALADRYKIERRLGEGGERAVSREQSPVIAEKRHVPTYGHPQWLLT